jgi:nitroreductase
VSQAQSLIRERYGDPGFETPEGLWNPVLENLLQHRSIRAFRADPLDDRIVPLLAAAAQSAPTCANLQAWSLLVVEDASQRAKLAELSGGQDHIRQAPLFLVWLLDFARLRRIARRHGSSAQTLSSLGGFQFGFSDALLAAQNAVVAAESLGLGTVYIGAIWRRLDEVWSALGLPKEVLPVVGLAVGHPDRDKPSAIKPRLPQSVVVHRERYDEALEDEALDLYNRRLQDFFSAQGLSHPVWTQQIADRLSVPDAFSDHLRHIGFAIE